jgi:hypothetical protein
MVYGLAKINSMKKILLKFGIIFLIGGCEKSTNLSQEIKKTEQMQNDFKDLPFPVNNDFTNDYLISNFWKCNYDTAGEELAYFTILPNFVKPTSLQPQTIDGLELTNIGIYKTIDENPYLEVWVAYETITNQITISDWLENILHKTGETILNKNKIQDQFLDYLTYQKVQNGEKVISRLTLLKKDNRYFVLKVSTNEKMYPQLAETIQHIATSWGLK